MKYICIILLLFGTSNKTKFSDSFIEELSANKEFDIIVCLPVINNDDTLIIGTTNTILYHSLFLQEYQDSLSFKDFLYQLLNGTIKMDIKYVEDYNFQCIKTRLDTLQAECGFDYIKRNFIVQKKENQFIPTAELTQSELNSLVNIFFNKEYIIVFNDYSGNFIFNEPQFKKGLDIKGLKGKN